MRESHTAHVRVLVLLCLKKKDGKCAQFACSHSNKLTLLWEVESTIISQKKNKCLCPCVCVYFNGRVATLLYPLWHSKVVVRNPRKNVGNCSGLCCMVLTGFAKALED